MLRTCSPALARPPLSVTIEAEARPSTLGPAASLPTPAPSPSRTGTALRLPLQSPSEASIQVSSVVVSGELESAACAPRGEEAGGVKVMLETLRDKGTLKGEEPLEVQPIPNLSKPFVLPPLETNPRLPKNLFDCTHTITLPDLPSTEPLPDPLLCDEDQVMVSLPSPISPTSASSLRRIRPRSSSREMTFPEPPVSSSLSAIQPRPDSATCEAPAYPLGMAPYRDPQSPLNLDPATLLANCGIRSGKRRQMNGLDTLRHLDHNAIVNAGGAAAAEDSDRYSKKRPALMTYTSFEDEFGLKPPRLITDEHNDEEESDHSEDKSDRKERKWWHLSG
ncbi:uncharacterized protein JCM15063_002718 [Sporobolomyces koalae]|uniref:uncharacterized protein n=1 Tax=Sporobolomyces koalae TaxID=500713 RepID=UPI0031742CEA